MLALWYERALRCDRVVAVPFFAKKSAFSFPSNATMRKYPLQMYIFVRISNFVDDFSASKYVEYNNAVVSDSKID